MKQVFIERAKYRFPLEDKFRNVKQLVQTLHTKDNHQITVVTPQLHSLVVIFPNAICIKYSCDQSLDTKVF